MRGYYDNFFIDTYSNAYSVFLYCRRLFAEQDKNTQIDQNNFKRQVFRLVFFTVYTVVLLFRCGSLPLLEYDSPYKEGDVGCNRQKCAHYTVLGLDEYVINSVINNRGGK